MLSVYDCKPAFQQRLRPLVLLLAGTGIRPNHITLATLLICAMQGIAIALVTDANWPLLLLPAVLLLRIALNAIDGLLAKEHQLQSRLGAVLNEVCDAASDALLYLPLCFIPGLPAVSIVALTITGIIGEIAGLAGVCWGDSRCNAGPMGKSDRALLIGTLAFVLGVGVEPGTWSDFVFTLAVLLALVTLITRTLSVSRPRLL